MNPDQLLERFSTHLRNVVARSMALATSLRHGEVSPLHLLLMTAEEGGSVGAEIVKKLGVDISAAYNLLDKQPELKKVPAHTATAAIPGLNNKARQALEKAMLTAHERSHSHVGTEHLLFGIVNAGDKQIQSVFKKSKLSMEMIMSQLEEILQTTSKFPDIEEVTNAIDQVQGMSGQAGMPTPLSSKAKTSQANALDFFTTNLTSKRVQKNIDPVIGRDREIERLVNILSRRTKNNPVLVGEPGVGKTAIVEGLAKKISLGQVPEVLKNKRLLALDITLLLSGTIYRGEFEARLKQVIDEVIKSPNCILFIDELHNIIGAGSSHGAMDAANILKPALARGELRCIGATTIDEYKKHISSDPALERRFQEISVNEPSGEETKKILSGIKKYYEGFHNTTITNEAIEAAVELSERYIHDSFLPDKAIDLLDEACAAVKTRQKSTPLQTKRQELIKDLEEYEENKKQAIRNEQLNQAVGWKKKITGIKRKLTNLEKQIQAKVPIARKKITKKNIAKVLESKLNIRSEVLLANKWEELEKLPVRLKKNIIGQDKVINTLVNRLHQAHIGLGRGKKPLASFMFVGPSGVGKTELSKVLAHALYHDKRALVKIDMSEFAEQHSVSKLLGSPAGYIGHKERNRFLDEIRKRPYCVVLFDEIDKAHTDVAKLLLQILDEGELTDSSGKKTNFHHALIILTTNLGSEFFKSGNIGFGNPTLSKERANERDTNVINKLKEEFSPAMLNRLNDTCIFSQLKEQDIAKIVSIKLQRMAKGLLAKQSMGIKFRPSALVGLAKQSFDPDFGARHVEKAIQNTVHELLIDVLKKSKRKASYTLVREKTGYKLV